MSFNAVELNYYKYQDDYTPLGDAVTFVDHASNMKNPPWSLILPEKRVDYDFIPEVTRISKEEFDNVWSMNLSSRSRAWLETKAKYVLRARVSGYIEIFFPQGVIVDLGNDALGVADWQAWQASTKPEFMSTGYKVTAVVSGYDEENQWVVLDSPQVGNERREKVWPQAPG
jgi:hypothetical protein